MLDIAKVQLAAIAGVGLAVARFGVQLLLGPPARAPKDSGLSHK